MKIYTALSGVKEKHNRDMLIDFSRGAALEKRIYEAIINDRPPVLLKGINSHGLTHNKSDVARVSLVWIPDCGDQARVTVTFTARPDFVHQKNGRVVIIDSKLGDAYPGHLVQAQIIGCIYRSKYGIDPDYYLYTNSGSKLFEINLRDPITRSAFAMFCIGCMAWQNVKVVDRELGGLFGGWEEVGWKFVLGEGVDPQKIARESFGIIQACFDSLLTQKDGVG